VSAREQPFMMNAWCEVTGRGSGERLDDLHRVDTERPVGQLQTFCGVIISAAFRVHHPRPGSLCRPCRRAAERRAFGG